MVSFSLERWLLLQLVPTLLMTGVIWQVQVVQYPLFTHYHGHALQEIHRHYTPKISYVVIPFMVAELVLGLLFCLANPSYLSFGLMVPVVGVWLSTFLLSVPRHQSIGRNGFGEESIQLVRTNWPRTFLWSLRSILILYFLW